METAVLLRSHVETLASRIGGRDARKYENLRCAADYIEAELQRFGYRAGRQSFDFDGLTFDNVEAQLTGTRDSQSILSDRSAL